jgi:hypothetical protein
VPIKHQVTEGDCIASLGMVYGLFPDTIWKDDANRELRDRRGNPNVLMPGDVVVVPDKRVREVSKPSDEHHKFRRRGVPEKLLIQLMTGGQPRAFVEYTLEIDGRPIHGCTDDQGRLEHWIPPAAKEGRLLIGEGEEYELAVGALPPLAEETGVRRRLVNLGYLDNEKADENALQLAVQSFQADNALKVTGELDQQTREKLREIHGS